MVKSKWGLALSAVATVIASLIMSVGICALFGLTPSLSGRSVMRESHEARRCPYTFQL